MESPRSSAKAHGRDVIETVIHCNDCNRTLAFDMGRHLWIVLLQEKEYVVGNGSDQSKLAVLPFLELSLDEFQRQVSQFQKANGVATFPFEFFVRAGLEHGSPHWTDCALRWLSGLQPLRSIFREHLERIVRSPKRYHQQTRQLARCCMLTVTGILRHESCDQVLRDGWGRAA